MPRNSFSGNICFEASVLCLCSVRGMKNEDTYDQLSSLHSEVLQLEQLRGVSSLNIQCRSLSSWGRLTVIWPPEQLEQYSIAAWVAEWGDRQMINWAVWSVQYCSLSSRGGRQTNDQLSSLNSTVLQPEQLREVIDIWPTEQLEQYSIEAWAAEGVDRQMINWAAWSVQYCRLSS